MPVYTCPNGHDSTEPDYCSECGKKLSPAAGTTAPETGAPATGEGHAATLAQATASTGEVCPECGTRRASATAVFCEVCRYNFATKMPWSPSSGPADASPPAVVTPTVVVAPATPAAAAPTPAPDADPLLRWEVLAVVDASLNADPDPTLPPPVGEPERVFPLDFPENLIGRRSERRGIFPEVDLSTDSGVSSRHAILYREANGTLSLLDVGSTNGTQLNGADVTVGVRTPLHDGDQITLGCWTRLTVRVASRGGGQQP